MTPKKQTVLPEGTVITKCPPRAAQGLQKQKMRAVGGTRLPINKRPTKEPKLTGLVLALANLPNK